MTEHEEIKGLLKSLQTTILVTCIGVMGINLAITLNVIWGLVSIFALAFTFVFILIAQFKYSKFKRKVKAIESK